MDKTAVVEKAILWFIGSLGASEYVATNNNCGDLEVGFTSDCPIAIKEQIISFIKEATKAVNYDGYFNEDFFVRWYEKDIRTVTRKVTLWR